MIWVLFMVSSCTIRRDTPPEPVCPSPLEVDALDEDDDGWSPCASELDHRDCNDQAAAVFPGAPEVCNGTDDDCDGVVSPAELDLDQDGWALCAGDCDDTRADLQDDDVDGDGFSTCDGDCDDRDPARFPLQVEVCNGLDDDCDDRIPDDELDVDGDGQSPCAGDCDDTNPELHSLDRDGDGADSCSGLDCDDRDPERSPHAVELCNGRDDDCDDIVDEACQ